MTGAAIPANSIDVQSKGWSHICRQLKQVAFGIAVVSGGVAAADHR